MLWQKLGHCLLDAIIAYCCGNLNGAIITSRYHYNSDVREKGSGNAGLTNFYRNYGTAFMAWVVFIDLVKAIVAVLAGGIMMAPFGLQSVGKGVAFLFVILGHMFPIAYDFRGGKGVLSALGALIVIDWRLALSLVAVFILLLLTTRYVSLGSLAAAFLAPIGVWFFQGDAALTALTAVCGALVIFMHRSNIGRLLHGTESKFSFPGQK